MKRQLRWLMSAVVVASVATAGAIPAWAHGFAQSNIVSDDPADYTPNIIDPPHAAVHWRGRFRNKGGQEAETDILDLIEVKDGRISSLTTFFDTALAAAMLAPA